MRAQVSLQFQQAGGDHPVGDNFPMTWNDWKGGVENAYQFLAEFEARIAQGEALLDQERILFQRLREVTVKYSPDGRKKRSNKTPLR